MQDNFNPFTSTAATICTPLQYSNRLDPRSLTHLPFRLGQVGDLNLKDRNDPKWCTKNTARMTGSWRGVGGGGGNNRIVGRCMDDAKVIRILRVVAIARRQFSACWGYL
eukprot:scaffold22532_cov93-Cylindrotheca_fusiformis.AAC.4